MFCFVSLMQLLFVAGESHPASTSFPEAGALNLGQLCCVGRVEAEPPCPVWEGMSCYK